MNFNQASYAHCLFSNRVLTTALKSPKLHEERLSNFKVCSLRRILMIRRATRGEKMLQILTGLTVFLTMNSTPPGLSAFQFLTRKICSPLFDIVASSVVFLSHKLCWHLSWSWRVDADKHLRRHLLVVLGHHEERGNQNSFAVCILPLIYLELRVWSAR